MTDNRRTSLDGLVHDQIVWVCYNGEMTLARHLNPDVGRWHLFMHRPPIRINAVDWWCPLEVPSVEDGYCDSQRPKKGGGGRRSNREKSLQSALQTLLEAADNVLPTTDESVGRLDQAIEAAKQELGVKTPPTSPALSEPQGHQAT